MHRSRKSVWKSAKIEGLTNSDVNKVQGRDRNSASENRKKVKHSPPRPREVDGLNVALVAAFPASFVSTPKKSEPKSDG